MSTNFSDRILGRDTHANRPAATAVPEGSVYSCSDHSIAYRSDGATWSDWLVLGTPAGPSADGDPVPFIGKDTAFRSSAGTSITVNVPAGVEDGDLLILHIGIHDVAAAGITATGWTSIRSDHNAGGANSFLFYRVASSEPASYSPSWGASRYAAAAITAWRGVDPSDPIGGHNGQTQSDDDIDCPTLTPDAGASRILHFGTIRVDTRDLYAALRYEVASSGGTTSGVVMGMTDQGGWAGATATGQLRIFATGSTSNSSNAGQVVALNAA